MTKLPPLASTRFTASSKLWLVTFSEFSLILPRRQSVIPCYGQYSQNNNSYSTTQCKVALSHTCEWKIYCEKQNCCTKILHRYLFWKYLRLKPEMQNSGLAYKILASQHLRLGWKLSLVLSVINFLRNERNRQREEYLLSDFSGGCVTIKELYIR